MSAEQEASDSDILLVHNVQAMFSPHGGPRLKSPTVRSLSSLLSELTGLPVTCTPKPRFRPSHAKRVYGIYNELATDETILLRADLPLLASMAGSRTGLSSSLVADKIKTAPIDGDLRNAMHEVLNLTSTLLSGGHRVVLKSMCMDTAYLTGPARSVLNFHSNSTSFEVSVQGYTGGELSIFSEA